MSRRIEDAIAQLELLGRRLSGTELMMLNLALEIMRPRTAAERQRKRRKTDKDVTPNVTGSVTVGVTDRVTSQSPNSDLVPSPEKQNETGSSPESSSPLSLLSPAKPQRFSSARAGDSEVRAAVWRAYAIAYRSRYRGIEPTRNAKVNSQIAQFVTRIPAEDACNVVTFYVTSNNARYVASGHSIGCLLQDAEKLRTEYLAGAQMTASRARRLDERADLQDGYAAARARLAAEDEVEAIGG